jgi:hypothetical protein
MRRSDRHAGQAGQAIVVMLAAILAAVALLALIIDGGNVLAHQRVSQAGADATSEAGAVMLAHRLAGATEPAGGWDANIAAKLTETATANNMSVGVAYYTDICGIPLQADGTAALDGDGRESLAVALEVGNAGNLLPAGAATTPDCPNKQVGPVAGVLVIAETVIDAYVARAIGIPTFTISTRATAVTGYLQGFCDASEGIYCALLPVAFPVNVIECNGSNKPSDTGTAWTWNTLVKIPLCNSSPGNVGWLDWSPPSGGAGELVCSILVANNPAVDLPSWQYVTQTGNQNGGGGACGMSVEDAIRTYDGKVVLVPQFDLTCNPAVNQGDPDSSMPAVVTAPNYGCPPGALGGNGTNTWYRMPSFAFFELCSPATAGCEGLHGAYISGTNTAICNTGNGAASCLVGKFRDILATGTVGAGVGSGTGSKALGVQLIR